MNPYDKVFIFSLRFLILVNSKISFNIISLILRLIAEYFIVNCNLKTKEIPNKNILPISNTFNLICKYFILFLLNKLNFHYKYCLIFFPFYRKRSFFHNKIIILVHLKLIYKYNYAPMDPPLLM